MLGISTRQLEIFVSVASAGTVSGAAQRLFLTQPAVSMALAELERQLGAQLFDRDRGRLHLSPRGRELLPAAQEVIERIQEMQHRPDHPVTLTGELRVGASNTVGNYLVGDLLGPFISRHPDVSLQVTVDNTESITAGLLDHSLDVACVEGPVNHHQLEVLPWRDDALVVCAAPGDPLAREANLETRHFKGAKWILREHGSAMRAQAELALASLPPGRILLELGQVEAIKQAVIAGMGIACLPRAAVAESLATGRLSVLPTPFLNLHRRLSLVLHKSRYRGVLIEAFVESLAPGADSITRS